MDLLICGRVMTFKSRSSELVTSAPWATSTIKSSFSWPMKNITSRRTRLRVVGEASRRSLWSRAGGGAGAGALAAAAAGSSYLPSIDTTKVLMIRFHRFASLNRSSRSLWLLLRSRHSVILSSRPLDSSTSCLTRTLFNGSLL